MIFQRQNYRDGDEKGRRKLRIWQNLSHTYLGYLMPEYMNRRCFVHIWCHMTRWRAFHKYIYPINRSGKKGERQASYKYVYRPHGFAMNASLAWQKRCRLHTQKQRSHCIKFLSENDKRDRENTISKSILIKCFGRLNFSCPPNWRLRVSGIHYKLTLGIAKKMDV